MLIIFLQKKIKSYIYKFYSNKIYFLMDILLNSSTWILILYI